MLEVAEISKNFGQFKAIDRLSFKVKIGDVMGFLGPNGAGKTTSMRLITGYLNSDNGSVRINNKDIYQDPIFTKSMIGYLPEGVPLYLDFSPTLYLDYVCQAQGTGQVGQHPDHVPDRQWRLPRTTQHHAEYPARAC